MPEPQREFVHTGGPQPALPVAPVAAADGAERPPSPAGSGPASSSKFVLLLRQVEEQHVHEIRILNSRIQSLLLKRREAGAQCSWQGTLSTSKDMLPPSVDLGHLCDNRLVAMTPFQSIVAPVLEEGTLGLNASFIDDQNSPTNSPRTCISSGPTAKSITALQEPSLNNRKNSKNGFRYRLTAWGGGANSLVGSKTSIGPEASEYEIHKSKRLKASVERLRDWQMKVVREDIAKSTPVDQREQMLKRDTRRHRMLLSIDMAAGVVICLNCLQIGASSEFQRNWRGWVILDAAFTCVFFLEIVMKVVLLGSMREFCRTSWMWAWFDLFIVALTATEFAFTTLHSHGLRHVFGQGTTNTNTLLLRTIRLFRLARLVHFVRLPMLKELRMMLQGMGGGTRTLVWAMILLATPLYVVALVFRETLGEGEERFEEFESLWWSLFTVFRCVMGDCTNDHGQPIFVIVVKRRGWAYAFCYCMIVAITFFGLFNVIAAIFVENTLAAAKSDDVVQRRRRLQDNERKTNLATRLIEMFREARKTARSSETETRPTGLDLLHDDDNDLQISRTFFAEVMQQKDVQYLLDDLDIAAEDRIDLFEILDADGSGHLELHELVYGIIALRGDPRRSDTVACRLLLGSIQEKVDELDCIVKDHHREMRHTLSRTVHSQSPGFDLQ